MAAKVPDTVKAGREVAKLEVRLRQAKWARDVQIRSRYAEGNVTLADLAAETGISRQQVFNIIHRKEVK